MSSIFHTHHLHIFPISICVLSFSPRVIGSGVNVVLCDGAVLTAPYAPVEILNHPDRAPCYSSNTGTALIHNLLTSWFIICADDDPSLEVTCPLDYSCEVSSREREGEEVRSPDTVRCARLQPLRTAANHLSDYSSVCKLVCCSAEKWR